ncbi:MAG: hypothetical protein GAS50_10390, partial [Desulfobacterales bacterium]|nr:hypothetical protein [Desulfobacterales bacterium]
MFSSETKGLPQSILSMYKDATYHIPISDKIRSLNLSTAVGIALYESLRFKALQISITPEPLNHEPVNGYAGSLRVWFLSSESLS